MNLKLAIVSSSTDSDSGVRLMDDDQNLTAAYSAAIITYGISIRPDDLVAVDVSANQPTIVYRWRPVKVDQIADNRVIIADESFAIPDDLHIQAGDTIFIDNEQVIGVAVDGKPDNIEQFCAHCFPYVEAYYQPPKTVVENGYDTIVQRYTEWAQAVRAAEREQYTAIILDSLSSGDRILELGCGSGIPTTQRLAEHFNITAVDISAQQINEARQRIPAAHFIHADMTALDFESASFEAVIAFYSLIHVPRAEQTDLFKRIANWLRPDGLLVVTMGAMSMPASYEGSWLGVPMFWSSYDSRANQQMVEDAGFRILSAEESIQDEDGQQVKFLWVVARKSN